MRKVLIIILMTAMLLSCTSRVASRSNSIIIGSIRDGFMLNTPRIYAVDENGNKMPLSPPFSDAINADWSPDSQWVVYQTTHNIDPQLVIIKANGTNGYSLTTHDYPSGRNPAWSPNGKQIAAYFTNDKNQNGIYIVDVSCILQSQECAPDYQFVTKIGRMPSWSPDGNQLAFWRDGQIFVLSIDAPRDIKRITPEDITCSHPDWSPIGDNIAMRCAVPSKGKNIFLVHSDGSNFRNITNSESQDLMPIWSPDGTKIAFASDRAEDLGKSIINEGIYSNAVYIMNSDGTNVKRVSPYNNESIDWIDWVGP